MANNRRKNKKAEEQARKKLLSEEDEAARDKAEKAKQEAAEKEAAAREREEQKNALKAEQMEKLTRYKCVIATLAALCFVFVAGIAYNWYSSGGHIFDDKVVYFSDIESEWHMFNGRHVRMKVDSAFKWYDGVGTDEATGETVMQGKTASCLIWLDSGNFMSLTVDNEEDFNTLQEIMAISDEYIKLLDSANGNTTYYSETLERRSAYFEGQIKRPDAARFEKMNTAYSELMSEWGFEKGDYYMYELTLDTSARLGNVMVTTIVYSVLAVVFLVAAIIAGVKYHTFKKVNGIKLVRE